MTGTSTSLKNTGIMPGATTTKKMVGKIWCPTALRRSGSRHGAARDGMMESGVVTSSSATARRCDDKAKQTLGAGQGAEMIWDGQSGPRVVTWADEPDETMAHAVLQWDDDTQNTVLALSSNDGNFSRFITKEESGDSVCVMRSQARKTTEPPGALSCTSGRARRSERVSTVSARGMCGTLVAIPAQGISH